MSDVYLGNPNLKKANTPIEFTEEQVIEFLKCKEDPVYFANNYIKIVSLDEGLTQFHPYHFQEKLINRFHENRFNICKMHDRLVSLPPWCLIFCTMQFSTIVSTLVFSQTRRQPQRTSRKVTNCRHKWLTGYYMEQRIDGVGKWQ